MLFLFVRMCYEMRYLACLLVFPDFESRGESKLWIVKPSNQNQGRGIRVTANFSELRNQFSLNTPSCPRPRPQSRESPLQAFSPRVVPLEPSKLKAKSVEKKNQMSKQNTHCSRSSIAGPPSFLTRPPSKSVRRRMFIAGLEAEIQQTRKCSTFRLDPSVCSTKELMLLNLVILTLPFSFTLVVILMLMINLVFVCISTIYVVYFYSMSLILPLLLVFTCNSK